jgi:hypothetical protein
MELRNAQQHCVQTHYTKFHPKWTTKVQKREQKIIYAKK